jgi:putative transposase
MDFVFDELANGRKVKTLTVVDDCTKESVQIAVDTAIPALYVTRVLDQVKAERGLPKVIRTDNGPEFAGRTMQAWAARNQVELRFIQPGKPVQNAYIESFNSRLRDECLSQHWFASLSHMRSVIDNWREDYNHHRPHCTLGYLPPARYAAQCRQRAGGIAPSDQSIQPITIQPTDSESSCC